MRDYSFSRYVIHWVNELILNANSLCYMFHSMAISILFVSKHAKNLTLSGIQASWKSSKFEGVDEFLVPKLTTTKRDTRK